MKPTVTCGYAAYMIQVYSAYIIPGLLAPGVYPLLRLSGMPVILGLLGVAGAFYGLHRLGDWCQAFFFREEVTEKEDHPRLGRFVLCYPALVLFSSICLVVLFAAASLLLLPFPLRALLAVAGGGAVFWAGWQLMLADVHVRGPRRFTYQWVLRTARKLVTAGAAVFPFGGVPVVWKASRVFFLGKPGRGKTTFFRMIMAALLPRIGQGRNARAMVYDPKGNLIGWLRDTANCPVHSLHPFYDIGVGWDMAADITEPGMIEQFGATLIPAENGGNNRYFSDAARAILIGVIESFRSDERSRDKWTFRDLLCATMNRQRLREIFSRPGGRSDLIQKYLEAKEWSSILSSLDTYLGAYRPIAAAWSHSESISLGEWSSGRSVLVLGDDERAQEPLRRVNALVFQVAKQFLLSNENLVLPGDEDPREVFIFLDELREFTEGRVHAALIDIGTRGREFGVGLFLGTQSLSGVRDAANDDQQEEMLGLCDYVACLGISEPETAEPISRRIGEREVIRESVTTTEQGERSRSRQTISERLVIPKELDQAPPVSKVGGLWGFFVGPEPLGIWKTVVPFPEFADSASETAKIHRRPEAKQKLRDWDREDLDRLGLPLAVLDDGKEEQEQEEKQKEGAGGAAAEKAAGAEKKPRAKVYRYTKPGTGTTFEVVANE